MTQNKRISTAEAEVETRLVHEMSKMGGLCLKYFNPAQVGYPDRLCMLPDGVTFWVELKSPIGHERKIQKLRMESLKKLGQTVYVAHTCAEVEEILDNYRQPASHEI